MITSTLIKYGLAAAIVAAVLGGLYLKGRSDGAGAVRAEIAAEIEKARKERSRVDESVRQLPDDDLFDRLLRGR